MPLPAGFWGTGWEANLYPHEMPSPSVVTFTSNADWIFNRVSSTGGMTLIQGFLNENNDPLAPPASNVGFLLGKQTTNPDVQLRIGVTHPVFNNFVVDPPTTDTPLQSVGNTDARLVDYRCPFVEVSGTAILDWRVRNNAPSGSILYYLFHVQPVAFQGYVAAVIGAILRYAGVQAANINQGSFDHAYDEEVSVGATLADRPWVEVIPQQGEQIIDTVKRVAQHWSHLIGFDLQGRITLTPANSADTPHVVIGEGANLKEIAYGGDELLLSNRCDAMHGAFTKSWRITNSSDPEAQPPYAARWEPRLKSDYTGFYIDRYENIESQDKFGVRDLGDRIRGTGDVATVRQLAGFVNGQFGFRNIDVITEGEDIQVFALPLFYLKTRKDSFMEIFLSNEAVPRRRGYVEQDLMGLDQDIGSVLTFLFVYQDGGQEVTRYRVIGQTVDFNSFTVRSEVLEAFPTEFPTASVEIWQYINEEAAPVGTTELVKRGNTKELTIELTTEPGLEWYCRLYASEEGGPWYELTSGWEAQTANLSEMYNVDKASDYVDVAIQGADNVGGELGLPTKIVNMPQAN